MVMDASRFEISWKSFETHLKQSNRDFYQDLNFSDVTLVSDDLVENQAHRLVLSACSPVFRKLLISTASAKHPLLYLKGVKDDQLKSILEFVYFGSTKLDEDKVDDFVKAGQELQIKDLTQNSENIGGENIQLEVEPAYEMSDQQEEEANNSQLDEIRQEGTVKSRTPKILKTESLTVREEQKSKEPVLKEFSCEVCKATFKVKDKMLRHKIEAHDRKFACEHCDYVAKQRSHLKRHSIKIHEKENLQCNFCDYVAKELHYLTIHKNLIHDHKETNIKQEAREMDDITDHAEVEKLMQTEVEVSVEQENLNTSSHSPSATKFKQFQCPKCPKFYANKANMQRHYRSAHSK